MTDTTKPAKPQVEDLTAEELDSVTGGYLKIGDIAGESMKLRRSVDRKGMILSRDGRKPYIGETEKNIVAQAGDNEI
ncbi:hypothetical protein KUL25_03565 [Rhodobacteraceae bacterium N5(2021)]|uniref:Uncharacterized protein n=1 Tax=Gymnodinialimonas phycosphaerae TaxID=2841589 RepID=A0A975TXR7_9RHOB|nr:hypothetical protein [Gymnodinialimonas phycosphaerae]MBY4891837.1 hypothetical protein [Gymnodinialimonas phycosphaerae]